MNSQALEQREEEKGSGKGNSRSRSKSGRSQATEPSHTTTGSRLLVGCGAADDSCGWPGLGPGELETLVCLLLRLDSAPLGGILTSLPLLLSLQ